MSFRGAGISHSGGDDTFCSCSAENCSLPGDIFTDGRAWCFFHLNSHDNQLAISRVINNHISLVRTWSQIRNVSSVDLLYAEDTFQRTEILPKSPSISAYEYAEQIEAFIQEKIQQQGAGHGQSKT